MVKLFPGGRRRSWETAGMKGQKRTRKATLSSLRIGRGQVSDGEAFYVCRYFLWAEDVEVTDGTDRELLEKAEGKYDRVIVLDPEAAAGSAYDEK